MLKSTLENIRQYLEKKIEKAGYSDIKVKLDSISKDGDNSGLYLSLLRIEEETSIKPQTVFRYQNDRITGKVTNPDICLNLFVLVSAFTKDYGTGLQLISDVIYWINTIDHSVIEASNPSDLNNNSYKSKVPTINDLSIELQSLNMEQTNSLWQTIGTKIVPAVVYKIRMLRIAEPTSTNAQAVYKVETSLQNSPMLIKYKSGQELTQKELELLQEELVTIYANTVDSKSRIRLEMPEKPNEPETGVHGGEEELLKAALLALKNKKASDLTEIEIKALDKFKKENQ
ncbi:MAG: DUF4255 domain-containing protein [Paludibacteraceae bacterium]|nr:DUF4255 domain-containing protein [Paludibacteraceae bacterium]